MVNFINDLDFTGTQENVSAWFDADDAIVKLLRGNASEHEKSELRELGYNIPE